LSLNQYKEPEWIFPFDGMHIGDSFFIPTVKTSPLIYAAESGAKRAGIKIKAYTTVKEGHLGVRVWRVK